MIEIFLSLVLKIKVKTLMVSFATFLLTQTPHSQVAKTPVTPKQAKVAHEEITKKITKSSVKAPVKSTPAPVKQICDIPPEDLPANVDLSKVRATWLDWENQIRAENGLPAYTYNEDLFRTATIWSETSKQKGYLDHKRPGQSAYYDYKIIEAWFKNLGLEFKNVNRKTFTESIAWEYYSCDESDCTDKLTAAIRKGFNFFISEKGKKYSPHYDAIINPEFTQIGLGIIIDKAAGKYYLTVHYGTEITSSGSACSG